MGEYLLIPLVSAASVYLIWIVELFLPYPYVVEEIFKFFLVAYVVRSGLSEQLKLGIVLLTGLAFSFSEAIFYLFNYAAYGSLEPFLVRLSLTVPMHLATFIVLFVGLRKGMWFGLAGLILVIGLHYWFNVVVSVPFLN